MTPDAAKTKQLLEIIRNTSVPAQARAESLTYLIHEAGLDIVRGGLEVLLKEADEGRELKSDKEDEERTPLCPEIFIAQINRNGESFAVVTSGQTDTYLPCDPKEVEGLECGDPVLIDPKKGRVVDRDGSIPCSGDVVEVESVSDDGTPRVLVKNHEQPVLARLSHKVTSNGARLEPGNRVVFDPMRRFVHEIVEGRSDGSELLADLELIENISRKDLGAVHSVLDEMLDRAKQMVLHPNWAKQLMARPYTSYMLAGPTGTGKSMHVTVMAHELTDFVEELTGERISRVVLADASSFYSQWFGVTENKIASFFERLRTLGRSKLKTPDGRTVRVPLIVVLEECEALFRSRGEFGGSAHLFDRPLALMLQKLSSVGNSMDVPLLICALTNRPDLLDAAARRRVGVRQVIFGTLSAGQAASVLQKKVPKGLKLRDGDSEAVRAALINQVIGYVYGDDPEQGIAEARLFDGNRRILCRRDVTTGSMLEEGVSAAIDECLRQSHEAGVLLGIDADGIIRALHAHYAGLAATLSPQNLPEYCPQWFADEPLRVEAVRQLMRQSRRPNSSLVR